MSGLQCDNITLRNENLNIRGTNLDLTETFHQMTIRERQLTDTIHQMTNSRAHDQASIQEQESLIASEFAQLRQNDWRRIQQLARSSAESAVENERLTLEGQQVQQSLRAILRRIHFLEEQIQPQENPEHSEGLQECNPLDGYGDLHERLERIRSVMSEGQPAAPGVGETEGLLWSGDSLPAQPAGAHPWTVRQGQNRAEGA